MLSACVNLSTVVTAAYANVECSAVEATDGASQNSEGRARDYRADTA